MPLPTGTRIGPYDVVGPLGAGGMGEVYRARDTQLGRDVALKVLPDLFAKDPERLVRFEREARTLAALNHPNIAQIYGVAEPPSGGRALVMELVEGHTLADLISSGSAPVREALALARQIADALDYANERGVVHRDLKPANIKVTPDGIVKVLDFGLAKALDSGESAGSSVTMTSPAMTRAGVILGTAAYMSPEQAKGRTVDKRTDIWAFGCVLYELLTGHRAFGGEDVTDLVVAVMTKEPDWSLLPHATPARIVEILQRCVRKDPRERLRDIGDVRLDLDAALAGDVSGNSTVSPSDTPKTLRNIGMTEKLSWFLAGAALSATVATALISSGVWGRNEANNSSSFRLSLLPAESGEVAAPAISPDAKQVAYRARRADGTPVLWVRNLATGIARPLDGTAGAIMPFWSPNSLELGFFVGPKLKRIPAEGGPAHVIVENVGPFGGGGGSWAPDGTIVFGGSAALRRVNVDGGDPIPVTKLPGVDWMHSSPSFLPDGRHFLFTAKQFTQVAETSEQGIYLGSLDGRDEHRLLPDLSSAVYSPPGLIVFVREGTLTTVPFDAATGQLTGRPSPVGDRVAVGSESYLAALSAASDGTLAVRPPPAVDLIGNGYSLGDAELRLIDSRTGASTPIGVARTFNDYMALNPADRNLLAVALVDQRAGTQDLGLMDLRTAAFTPLTTTRGFTANPVWSADGNQLAYTYQPPKELDDIYIWDRRTRTHRPVIQTPTVLEHVTAWSHDGRHLLVFTSDDNGQYLSSWSFESAKLTRVVDANALEGGSTFSPHDNYVAFTVQEDDRPQVFVTAFPERSAQRVPITGVDGGYLLSWSEDGREILVATLSGHIASYPVSMDGANLSVGQPKIVIHDVGITARYGAATRDHSKILIRVSPAAVQDRGEIRLLFGWQKPSK